MFLASGLLYYTNSSLRSTTSEETSSGPTLYVEEEPEIVTVEDVQPVAKNSYAEIVKKDEVIEDSTVDGKAQAFELLDNLDIKVCYLCL